MRAAPPLPLAPVLAILLATALLAGAGAAHAQAPLTVAPHKVLFQPVPGRLIAAAAPLPAAAAVPGSTLLASSIGPGQQCRLAIRAAERAAGIPNQLMAAIGRVESGRQETDGSVNPWPWSINVEGEGHVFDSKAEAIAAVRAAEARGVRSIDVGCMQVNLQQHPDAFPTLEQAFDPVANAIYAAHFLVQLHDQTGTWPTATAWYHSATPELGADYQRRVMAVWPEEQQHHDDAATAAPVYASSYANGYTGGYTNGFHGGFANGFASGFGVGGAHAGAGSALSNGAAAARIIPLPGGAVGRGLAAYRAAPIPVVARPATPPPRETSSPG